MISHSRGIGGTGPLMRDTAGQGTARLAARPAAVHLRGARGVLTSLQKSTPCCREWRLTPSRQLSGRAGETHPSPRQLPQREKHPPSAQKAVWAPPLPSKALWAPPLPSKATTPEVCQTQAPQQSPQDKGTPTYKPEPVLAGCACWSQGPASFCKGLPPACTPLCFSEMISM